MTSSTFTCPTRLLETSARRAAVATKTRLARRTSNNTHWRTDLLLYYPPSGSVSQKTKTMNYQAREFLSVHFMTSLLLFKHLSNNQKIVPFRILLHTILKNIRFYYFKFYIHFSSTEQLFKILMHIILFLIRILCFRVFFKILNNICNRFFFTVR